MPLSHQFMQPTLQEVPALPSGTPLRILSVSKVFAGRDQTVQALRPVNLEVAAGEFVCLLGPSGCGKSTLLSMIAGLEAASSGEIWIDGRQVLEPSTECVLLFQEAALFPWLDVQQNVEFGLRQSGMPTEQRATVARRFLERMTFNNARDVQGTGSAPRTEGLLGPNIVPIPVPRP